MILSAHATIIGDRFRRLNLHQNPGEMLHIRRLENGLERPCGRSRPTPRRLASLVVADAFAGELTRGSIGTIRATVETENTRSYQGGVWLSKQGFEAKHALHMHRFSYASLLADEKRERNCVALEAASSRPKIQCRGVVIPSRFTMCFVLSTAPTPTNRTNLPASLSYVARETRSISSAVTG